MYQVSESVSPRTILRERKLEYGNCTWQQVISLVNYSTTETNVWSCQQNNSNNAWNFNLNNGNTNNNNKTNTNYLIPCAESSNDIVDIFLNAEQECYKNKRSKFDANDGHYHLAKIWSLIYSVYTGSYHPDGGICFVLSYPTYREVFAAKYWDRVVHHVVAPYMSYIADRVHFDNGDISHGNRKAHSAQTFAIQVQKLMKEKPNGVVFKFDIHGFFMSICRSMAVDLFMQLDEQYKPNMNEQLHDGLIGLIKILILSDPTIHSERRSAIEEWKNIRPEKSLFGNTGNGMPIGNFYSQIDAGLVLSFIDRVIHIPHFVDDFSGVADDSKQANEVINLARLTMARYGLTLHPKKIYIQPVRHGVKLCGRMIYKNRIYSSNRIIHAAFQCIYYFANRGINEKTAIALVNSFNSYSGILFHMTEYNTQKRLMNKVLELGFGEYVYFKCKNNHVICQLKNEYKPIVKSINAINNIDKFINSKIMAAIVQGSRSELPKVENRSGKWFFRSCYEQVEQTTDEVRCVEVVLLVQNNYAAAQQTNEFNAERGSDIRITPDYFDDPYVSVQNESSVE